MERLINLLHNFDDNSIKKILKSENEIIDNLIKDSLIVFEEKRGVLLDLFSSNMISELSLLKQRKLEDILQSLNLYFNQFTDFSVFKDKVKRENILSLIDDFITIIENSNIEIKLYGNSNFLKEQTNNNKKIEKRYNQIQSTLNDIEKASLEINSYYNVIKNTYEKFNEDRKKVEEYNSYYQTTKLEIEDLRFGIKGFFSNIENYTKTVNDSEQKIKKLIENSSRQTDENILKNEEKYTSAISKFIENTKLIEEKNNTIQTEINTLLQGANASKLAHIYENKRKEIEWQLWLWLIGIIFTTGAIIFISYYKFFDKVLTTELLLERFLIILPFLLLDIFFIFQYNLKNKIVEEYRFKSSTAISLFAFNELIKSHETDKSQDFITKSLENLFKSPLSDKDYQNPALSVLEKSYAKIENRVDKLIDKIPKK